MKKRRLMQLGITAALVSLVSGCGMSEVQASNTTTVDLPAIVSDMDTLENNKDGEHVITVDGTTEEYSYYRIEKTGDSDGDEADFYGENAAIFATNGGNLTLNNLLIHTNGAHANAVFSYGEGTTVNVSDTTIDTEGNCSGGLMTTGGGTTNATNLTIHTTGNSSAAIRSDRGGGTVNVKGGSYTTEGKGSPVIYSTADITVSDARMQSTTSQGVVVEGQNSVTLNNVDLQADNNAKNSDKSDTYQAVMIYQSMSGDADEGTASFTMKDGKLTNANGDIFFVNNTVAEITLNNANIINNGDGVFLRAEAAGWGSEGSNGGQVLLNTENQTINGDMLADDISILNAYLTEGSVFTGAINPEGSAGSVYVELDADSSWTLTADSYIGSLTCDADAIDLNGYTLYVNGKAYTEGSVSTGDAYEFQRSSGKDGSKPDEQNGGPGEQPGNGGPKMGDMPTGQGNASADDRSASGNDATPPEKPEGDMGGGPGGNAPMGAVSQGSATPPEKPEGDMGGGPGGNGGPDANGNPPAKPGE